MGPVRMAQRACKADLIGVLGGEEHVSPEHRTLVEVVTLAALMLESVTSLASDQTPWVAKVLEDPGDAPARDTSAT